MKTLLIAKDVALPVDAVTQKLAFLGRTGSGKTYAAMKLAELMLDAGAQVVALDPVGVWYGLRLTADGKRQAFDIPVFGGLYGDVPLEPTAGALIADVVVDRHLSAVIDTSQMIASEQARFAKDFATQFFQRKKSSKSPVHVFIEECQEFVPQNITGGGSGHDAKMLHAFERLIKLGRNFGVGASLISQRPQEVNKKALNQTECLFAFQMTGVHERKAMKAWISDRGVDDDIDLILPKLAVGRPRIWSPQWLQISKTAKINPKKTFDASSTPTVGSKTMKPKLLAAIDMKKLGDAMTATIERAEQADPKHLKRQVAVRDRRIIKLERQLEEQEPTIETIEVPVIDELTVGLLQATVEALQSAIAGARDIANARSALNGAQQRTPAVLQTGTFKGPRQAKNFQTQAVPIEGGSLPRGEAKVLTAVAQYPDGATREQITILTGYKRSTRDAYLQRLREKGFVYTNMNDFFATDEGLAALGLDFEPLPTGEALRDYWRDKLPEGERRVFEVLMKAYPESVDRETISDRTEYKRSTRDAYIQRLKTRQLINGTGNVLCAKDFLWGT